MTSKSLTKTCPCCKSQFQTYQSVNKKCCSRTCSENVKKAETFAKHKRVCASCGVDFLPARAAEGGTFCSYRCSANSRKLDRVHRNGYYAVKTPDHPFATKQGYVLEHRLVMEGHINRFLEPGEVVHHINHNTADNRIENLELMRDSEHKSMHACGKERDCGRFVAKL